ncbi:hypothetical protein KCP76_10110 [Salmonella enterica subsp. enterica serovar Weltevreden]|nr:hypothetical protein KCP76_10110 [Salmonella enterica subsp. enterica serovar Weltevreden]
MVTSTDGVPGGLRMIAAAQNNASVTVVGKAREGKRRARYKHNRQVGERWFPVPLILSCRVNQ